jgi:hypothetical protein
VDLLARSLYQELAAIRQQAELAAGLDPSTMALEAGLYLHRLLGSPFGRAVFESWRTDILAQIRVAEGPLKRAIARLSMVREVVTAALGKCPQDVDRDNLLRGLDEFEKLCVAERQTPEPEPDSWDALLPHMPLDLYSHYLEAALIHLARRNHLPDVTQLAALVAESIQMGDADPVSAWTGTVGAISMAKASFRSLLGEPGRQAAEEAVRLLEQNPLQSAEDLASAILHQLPRAVAAFADLGVEPGYPRLSLPTCSSVVKVLRFTGAASSRRVRAILGGPPCDSGRWGSTASSTRRS